VLQIDPAEPAAKEMARRLVRAVEAEADAQRREAAARNDPHAVAPAPPHRCLTAPLLWQHAEAPSSALPRCPLRALACGLTLRHPAQAAALLTQELAAVLAAAKPGAKPEGKAGSDQSAPGSERPAPGLGGRVAELLRKLAGQLVVRPAPRGAEGGAEAEAERGEMRERAREVAARWAAEGGLEHLQPVLAALARATAHMRAEKSLDKLCAQMEEKEEEGLTVDREASWAAGACDAALAVLVAVCFAAESGPAAVWAALGEEPKGRDALLESAREAGSAGGAGGAGGAARARAAKALAVAARLAREPARAEKLGREGWDGAAVAALRAGAGRPVDRPLALAAMDLTIALTTHAPAGAARRRVARTFTKWRGLEALRALAGEPGGQARARALATFKAVSRSLPSVEIRGLDWKSSARRRPPGHAAGPLGVGRGCRCALRRQARRGPEIEQD